MFPSDKIFPFKNAPIDSNHCISFRRDLTSCDDDKAFCHNKGCCVRNADILLYRYGIMGIGAVCHTLNPRLFPEDIVYIVGHAEDKMLMFDLTFLKLIEAVKPKLTSVEAFIIMTDRQHMPKNYKQVMFFHHTFGTCYLWVIQSYNMPESTESKTHWM